MDKTKFGSCLTSKNYNFSHITIFGGLIWEKNEIAIELPPSLVFIKYFRHPLPDCHY